ncbi:hypothetical protein OIU76_021517 [Salix suchowensis]|nr:hypothetical protein OIU76_021517 [Salix suchowensis]
MEESPGEGSIDKSRVLNVTPLRTLTPVLSHLDFSPFFPFSGIQNQSVPSGDHTPISSAVPINSFRSPEPRSAREANGNAGSSRRAYKAKGKKEKIASPDVDLDVMVENILQSYNLVEFEEARRYDGDKDSVGHVLLVFNLLRRQIAQLEDSKEATLSKAP